MTKTTATWWSNEFKSSTSFSTRGVQTMRELYRSTAAHNAQGTKKDPGPLYGVSGHAWQALGLALLVADI